MSDYGFTGSPYISFPSTNISKFHTHQFFNEIIGE